MTLPSALPIGATQEAEGGEDADGDDCEYDGVLGHRLAVFLRESDLEPGVQSEHRSHQVKCDPSEQILRNGEIPIPLVEPSPEVAVGDKAPCIRDPCTNARE